MTFLRSILLALSLALFGIQPVVASVISDGSSGVFRPISDFTLDLSGLTVPQYSSIFIDAGIKLTILTPTGGVFGDLLAANDIFVDGIIDAGSGSLGLLAGNQIVLRAGAQIIAGSLNLFAGNLNLGGDLILKSPPVIGRPGAGLIGGDITILPGADLTLRDDPSIIRGGDSTAGGELILGSGAFLRQTPTPVIFQAPDPIPIGIISAVPEPSTVLLLLPGLILLARGAWRKAAL